ncbi:kinase and exchange factor for Rac B-like [Oppia nitens]|uniref:kinase and exchange factor for Rac B-like n=1 Tax=Oppia nitens TaxID=1686743 RepID=UPI0023D9CABE|nr:kinase and exchange factor for Rac B-like [Oppia nitens]
MNDFAIINKIPENTRKHIKLFHVFDDITGFNVLVITIGGVVYGMGSNKWSLLGLGHDECITQIVEIPELSFKQVKQFINGEDFCLALTYDNRVYSWGLTLSGRLGRDINAKEIYGKPELITGLDNLDINKICCGFNHTLVVTSDGRVYGWGRNQYGQVVDRDYDVHKPIQLFDGMSNKFTDIMCYRFASMAIASDGQIYIWGNNRSYYNYRSYTPLTKQPVLWRYMGTNIDTNIIKFYEINDIFNRDFKRDIDLVNNENYLTIGQNLDNNRPVIIFDHIYHLFSQKHNKSILFGWSISNRKIYQILSVNELIETRYKSADEFVAIEHKLTHQTIDNQKYYNIDRNIINLKANDNFGNFNVMETLGKGGFGVVFKVKNKTNKNNYAIKIINILDSDKPNDQILQNVWKESKMLSKLNPQFVVKYYDSWIENNQFFIQMELCSQSLQNILEIKPNVLKRQTSQVMDFFEYYISCQIFKEIVECVEYLHHTCRPQVIHRDLKPYNILTVERPNNNRFIKLCDFGLATVHEPQVHEREFMKHTSAVGNPKYMAPEVNLGIIYNTKADIYSLGVIATQLFDVNIDYDIPFKSNDKILTVCMGNMKLIVSSMLSYVYNNRPSSQQILQRSNEWLIDDKCVKSDHNFDKHLLQLKQNEFKFFYEFVRQKLQYLCL